MLEQNEIQFPHLGIDLHVDSTAFQIFGIDIQWYGLLITCGLLLAMIYAFHNMRSYGVHPDRAIDAIIGGIIGAIVGARAYYVILEWDNYAGDWKRIFNLRQGGLAIYGGLIGALVVGCIIAKIRKVRLLPLLDLCGAGFLLGQGIGRWGNFFNQEAYGMATTVEKLKATGVPEFVINGMYIMGAYREPTFFYESIWNVFGFLALLIIRRYPYLKKGQLTGFYLIWYSTARFIIEGKRTDSLMLGNIKMAQLVSVIMIVIGIILFIYYKSIKKVSIFEQLYKEEPKKDDEPKKLFIKEENVTRV